MGSASNFERSARWPAGETASATDFVRHFGQYAATSLRQPIYITQHGRVNWALVSAELMAKLERAKAGELSNDARLDIILDSIATLVIQFDETLNISQMNLAARRHFQLSDAEAHTAHLTTLFRSATQKYLIDVCRRVAESGNAETFEIDSDLYPGRTLNVQVVKSPAGVVLTADVVSQTVLVRRTYAAATAASAAADATDILGRGRINIRGTITSANETLAALARTTLDKITGLRLASLFDQETRNAVRDGVEAMLTTGESFSIDANLLDGTRNNTRVKLGAGVERDAGSISGAAFLVIAC